MGEEISRTEYSEEDFQAYADQVSAELDEFRSMLDQWPFDSAHPRAGMELELNLVDPEGEPSMRAAEVLSMINDPLFVHELGKFNVELNLPPRQLGPTGLTAFYESMRSSFNDADVRASQMNARLVAIGMLPTLGEDRLVADSLVENPRFRVLNSELGRLRGGPLKLDLKGMEGLQQEFDSIAPEAACTSHQIHLQVNPSRFAAWWNASQAIAGVQLAMGANSPFVAGRRCYAESRIVVFDQATDTHFGPESGDDRPRVWFGDGWISSVLDLFEENSAHWQPILPELPEADTSDGPDPLKAMGLLNGTIYRWNRPVYDVAGGSPHLRIENRVLPAGPSSVDMVANLALYAGLARALAEQEHSVWTAESHDMAERNFIAGYTDGITAELEWPGVGKLPATRLVIEHLLGLAAAGLQSFGVDAAEITRYLGVIEQRASRGVNGASWQTDAIFARERAGESREQALRGMLGDYLTHQRSGAPVHEWEL